ncbi:SMP-30/gluconolactonase/LRE family protein [Rhizobacter sp. Root1221]|uniref:SMP-30/gluconolactonase/LRE family protein n=1 Tax=Rhizobacter sp. Root1221 TaxID=1736433 RepID=UPI0021008D1C|nr:SMP-30/gluconolactonase/LRE family protein [Rhizobacter sp. Root1221]
MLGEGTMWSPREQSLYWVDILGRTLYRYHLDSGAQARWQFDEEISAVAERTSAPGLIVTLRSGFAYFDPATGAVERLHNPEPERTGNRFNDGKCDAQGRFWGGTMDFGATHPTGALYRYEAGGRCERMDDGYVVTNGPTWSADGRTMYFNDTVHQQVNAFDLDPATGTLSNKRPWLKLAPGEGYPDGMTTDAAGRLWICHWGGACVTCHDPVTGEELARVELPTAHITNVAFGGPDFRTLFITSAQYELSADQLAAQPLAGSLFAVEVDSPGQAPHRFAG